MFTGFNLQLDENASIFGGPLEYMRLQIQGENHLNAQKAIFKQELEAYVVGDIIDGSKIQDEWFPQIDADIFISHSHNDKELACALAGWINKTFNLKCFIDSNVWGYSKELLDEMNDSLSEKREDAEGGYLYNYNSCNEVSAHVNMMLSVALQKMIDKVETVILLNTDNAVKVCSDTQMEKTYSPWIYSEIICTQFIRKKPLLAYRNYHTFSKAYFGITESVQFAMHSAISYTVSLKHLKSLSENNLLQWKREWILCRQKYDHELDALYEIMCPGEVENTKKLSGVLAPKELRTLQHAYSTNDMNSEEWENMQYVFEGIIRRGLQCCQECDRFGDVLYE